MILGRCSRHDQWGGVLGEDPGLVERLYLNTGLGMPLDPPVRAGQCGPGKGSLGPPIIDITSTETLCGGGGGHGQWLENHSCHTRGALPIRSLSRPSGTFWDRNGKDTLLPLQLLGNALEQSSSPILT